MIITFDYIKRFGRFCINCSVLLFRFAVRPQQPVLSMPDDMVDGQIPYTPFVCQANIGNPPGTLKWKVKAPNSDTFVDLGATIGYNATSQNCTEMGILSASYRLLAQDNGTVLRCELENTAIKPSTIMYAEETILVVPGEHARSN